MNIFSSLASAFGKLSKIGAVLAALYPMILSLVQTAEAALGSGNGSAKLAFVEDALKAAYATVQTAEVTWTDIQPAVLSTVNALVTAYNTIKAFAHGGQPATPTPAAAPVLAK